MEKIVEFKGKNQSWFQDLNFLYRYNKIYVMDNHNAALWCWLREINQTEKYNILHVDKHYDTRDSHIDEWLQAIPENFNQLTIDEYLSSQYDDPNFTGSKNKLMHWDNYFPIFHRKYKDNIAKYHFFTHRHGTMFKEMEPILSKYPINGFVGLINSVFTDECNNEHRWIVNIDLDYFFQQSDNKKKYIQLISNEAIDNFCEIINKHFDDKIAVITIALSPECCGNWDNSLKLMRYFAKKLNLDFDL